MGSNPGYLFYLRMSGTRPIYGLSNYCAILKKTDHCKVSAIAMALTWIYAGPVSVVRLNSRWIGIVAGAY